MSDIPAAMYLINQPAETRAAEAVSHGDMLSPNQAPTREQNITIVQSPATRTPATGGVMSTKALAWSASGFGFAAGSLVAIAACAAFGLLSLPAIPVAAIGVATAACAWSALIALGSRKGK